MSKYINQFNQIISEISVYGIEVLHSARMLQDISSEMKLIAFNGMIQASNVAKDNKNSLMTLSNFLSDLPIRILPDILEFENICYEFAKIITKESLAAKMFLMYSKSISKIMSGMNEKVMLHDFERQNILLLANLDKFVKTTREKSFSSLEYQTLNALFVQCSHHLIQIQNNLHEAQSKLFGLRIKMENIQRHGLTAKYMGSNILIESSTLRDNKVSFLDLVADINRIIAKLDKNIDNISDNINLSDYNLSQLKQSLFEVKH